MFRNRKSQKPGEELYDQFKQTFPNVNADRAHCNSDDQAGNAPAHVIQTLLHRPGMHNNDDDAMNGQDPTPRAAPVQDQWSMTPSMLDTTSFAFSSLANQPSAYYGLPSPTSSTLPPTVPSHTQQSAEFATPSMGMNLIAPIMNPPQNSIDPSTISNPAITMNALHAPFVSQVGNTLNPYAQNSFAPSPTFNNNGAADSRPENDSSFGSYELSPVGLESSGPQMAEGVLDNGGNDNDGGLRFDVLLRAPTAMVKDPHDIPVTYLNKGQAYAITVTDTAAMADPNSRPLRYRTFIRVSFEEEEQRSKPDSCWVLWQEGRGANEAHHRDGKLLAVEHVDPNQGGNGESRHPQIQLDRANFDGFAVNWTPNKSNGRYECTISVRFNFLSTDFSHSKGVKGIPVRLCAKTEVVATTEGPYPSVSEVSYCKVKLFRDHGAERKLSNDSLHVRKMIDKVKMQIAQAELGAGQGGDKRKRNNSISSKGSIKPSKQKRSFSISRGDSSRPSLEDDLHAKSDGLEIMLRSARMASYLNLRGDPQDDPDMFPVKLETDTAAQPFDWESSNDAIGMSRSYSPSSSHHSIASQNSDSMRPPIFAYGNSRTGSSRAASADWSNFSHQDSEGSRFSQTNPVKVQRVCGGDSEGPFEALGVNSTYVTPLDATKVPKYCFYVKLKQIPGDAYYHAVYLQHRTVADFIEAVSRKWKVDPSHVQRAVLVLEDGMGVVIDDDVIRELPEGKDMVAEFTSERCNSVESMDIDSPSAREGLEIRVHSTHLTC